MDTIEQNEPAVANDVVASVDTSVNDTQPAETGEVNVTEPQEAGEAPSLLAGKYKSPEELAEAYKNLESKLGQRDENLELVKELERTTGMSPSQIREALAQQQQAQLMQQYQDNPGGMALAEVQQLKSQLALQAEERALNEFLNSEEGRPYQPFKDRIQEAAFNMPSMKDLPYADVARELFGNARAQGQQDAYKKIETKQMTQATSVSTGEPKRQIGVEDMKNMSTAELEALLPHA